MLVKNWQEECENVYSTLKEVISRYKFQSIKSCNENSNEYIHVKQTELKCIFLHQKSEILTFNPVFRLHNIHLPAHIKFKLLLCT